MSDPRPVPQPPVRKVPCPNCGQPAVFGASNRWRPFCGERCRDMDLGAWASESYRMPAANPPDDPDPQG